jgi:hypothetical protein
MPPSNEKHHDVASASPAKLAKCAKNMDLCQKGHNDPSGPKPKPLHTAKIAK